MLLCEDCGHQSVAPRGWVAVRLERPEEQDGPIILVYCPDGAVQFEDDEVSPIET